MPAPEPSRRALVVKCPSCGRYYRDPQARAAEESGAGFLTCAHCGAVANVAEREQMRREADQAADRERRERRVLQLRSEREEAAARAAEEAKLSWWERRRNRRRNAPWAVLFGEPPVTARPSHPETPRPITTSDRAATVCFVLVCAGIAAVSIGAIWHAIDGVPPIARETLRGACVAALLGFTGFVLLSAREDEDQGAGFGWALALVIVLWFFAGVWYWQG